MAFRKAKPAAVSATPPPSASFDPFAHIYHHATPASKGVRLQLWLLLSLIVAGAGGIAAGLLWTARRAAMHAESAPFVYVELRAVDSAGHPVAGATVATSGRKLGVTDSFGEWRKFLRANRGSSVVIVVSKESPSGAMRAEKNLVVPVRIPADGEFRLSASLQLEPAPPQLPAPVPVAASKDPPPVTAPAKAEPATELASARVILGKHQVDRWQDVDRGRLDHLGSLIVPELQRRLANASPATGKAIGDVVVSHLPLPGGSGLIMVRCKAKGAGSAAPTDVSLLRNYGTTPQLSAESIVNGIHAAVSDQAGHRQWRRLNVTIWGHLSADARVYVSGNAAQLVGDHNWQFWGPINGEHNLTIVDNGAVVYRNRLASFEGRIAAVSLPHLQVAQGRSESKNDVSR